MSTIKTVALAGASGNLGPSILNALLAAGRFEVTVLTREGSKSTFPPGTQVVDVDYSSLESLTNALRGQDAIISTLGTLGFSNQIRMVDAAIAAGVKCFIPSGFGSDIYNAKARPLPSYRDKVAVEDYLEQMSKESSLSYTPIINAAFFDWGMSVGFLGLKNNKATLYDGGDVPFSVSRLSAVGQAVVGVLSHPEETKNRPVYVHEAVVTQNQLLSILKAANPGAQWEVEEVNTEKLEKEAYISLAAPEDERKPGLMYDFLRRAIWGEGYGGELHNVDNELLDVKMMSASEIRELVESYVEK